MEASHQLAKLCGLNVTRFSFYSHTHKFAYGRFEEFFFSANFQEKAVLKP